MNQIATGIGLAIGLALWPITLPAVLAGLVLLAFDHHANQQHQRDCDLLRRHLEGQGHQQADDSAPGR